MKRILFILIAAFSLTTCVNLTSCVNDRDIYVGVEKRAAVCEAFEDYAVPVKAGYVTIVTCGDDTLAVADQPVTIKVPKGTGLATKSGEAIKVDFAILGSYETYSKYWQAVMFEDTEHGDYDYNDLIIHVKNIMTNGGMNQDLINIAIQPIALGSIKDIKLGCILADNSEHIISENVRADMFKGEEGFINTKDEIAPVRYKLEPVIVDYKVAKNTPKMIAWFIEVAGKRYYAVTSDFNYRNYDMFNEQGMPYGLVVGRDNGTFNYSQEEVTIFNTYPDFGEWINGKATNIGVYDKKFISKYCNMVIPGKDGKKYKIWDYLDLE